MDQEKLLRLFNGLGIEDMERVDKLYELKGSFVNMECKLPNGKMEKLLQDEKTYYGAQACKRGSDRCYGLATDGRQLLVYEYGEGGSDAQLVVWKRID